MDQLFDFFYMLPTLTKVFVIVICGMFAYANIEYNQRSIQLWPTILTITGIFGTFIGIAVGLHSFDTDKIQESVPALLAGMKTAFGASVVGVGGALLIKLRYAVFGVIEREDDYATEGATIDDLVRHLLEVKKAISGDDESTLISQTKLLRQDSNDRLDGIKKAMQTYLEQMAENNSKALIEALKEVIRDFNAKINEQFGDNFKQLNEAVGQILVWQEKYRQQITEMIQQQELTSKNMATASERYSDLISKSEVFTHVAGQLFALLQSLEEQRSRLEQSLKSLGNLLVKASDGLPEIERKIVEMTRQVGEGVQSSTQDMQKTIRSLSQSLEAALTDQKKLITETVATTNREFNQHIKQITDKTKEQVSTLDAALEAELKKSLDSLGRQLAALSQKFASDYGPLTERLREVVGIARGI
jgi:DNA anti-recombination protein RmuC